MYGIYLKLHKSCMHTTAMQQQVAHLWRDEIQIRQVENIVN